MREDQPLNPEALSDLVESLKALLWQWDNHRNLFGMALQDARAAVAKAEGVEEPEEVSV